MSGTARLLSQLVTSTMRSRIRLAVLVLCAFALHQTAQAQASPPSSSSSSAATQGESTAVSSERSVEVSWSKLPSNIAHDQARIWLGFPKSLVMGHHLVPAFAVTGAAAGLIVSDSSTAPYFRETTSFGAFDRVFSGRGTSLATTLSPAAFYLAGLARNDSYLQKTSLLAGEALLDNLFLETALKASTHRLRPSEIPPNGDFGDTFFDRGHSLTSSGFPSGHASAAFAAATIFADRYQHHRWVPWVAYGLATAISFSRITGQDHFPSDVFVGAALGHSVGHFVVLRR